MTETLRQLETSAIPIEAVPNIRVVWYKGRYWTLDNRRLWVFQRLKRPIKVILCHKDFVDNEFYTKLSSFTGLPQSCLRLACAGMTQGTGY